MDAHKIEELKGFVHYCKQNPSALNTPSLAFFKNFLQSFGARVPSSDESGKDSVDISDTEIVESDVELDISEVVEPDNDPPQKMGNPSAEVTEENEEAAQLSKAKAMDVVAEGKFNEAIYYLTEAIMLNPKSAILYANRASIFIKLKKPNAAIRDADAALQINPDSAKGYKARGMARAMLGLWEEAARDLHLASNMDFDEDIGLMLKKVEPNAKKIEEHCRKYEHLRKDLRKNELEKKSRQDAEAASVFKDGQIIKIQSASETKVILNAASKASRLTIIYFTATWCGPCRYISPVYSSLAEKYPKVVFLKVDIDEVVAVALEWKVSSIPSFFFAKNGKEIDQLVGAHKNSLEQKIAQHAG